MITVDEDAPCTPRSTFVARSGATEFEIGHLHDDVPVERAGWWATATLRGAKVIAENHAGPIAAAEALAVQLMTGAMCTHCGGLVALSDAGAEAVLGTLTDGSRMTEARARGLPKCRWARHAQKWVRGCTDTVPEGERRAAPAGPNRADRRRAGRRGR